MTEWNGNGPTHRPVYDAENTPPDDLAVAFTEDDLEDIHGYVSLARQVVYTLIMCAGVVALGLTLFFIWKAT